MRQYRVEQNDGGTLKMNTRVQASANIVRDSRDVYYEVLPVSVWTDTEKRATESIKDWPLPNLVKFCEISSLRARVVRVEGRFPVYLRWQDQSM